jgi:antitoxin component YwqK of YwqJK toxin-antitoxin module
MNECNDLGNLCGAWERNYSNGNPWHRGQYLNGKMNGCWESYYLNGNPWYKGNYINDDETGYWEWYNHRGELIEKEFYL